MKRILTLMVLPVLMAFCTSPSVEEKIQKLNDEINVVLDGYRSEMSALRADSTMTSEQLAQAADRCVETAQGKINDICREAIRKNRNNGVALEALKNICYDIEPEELETIIASLGEDNRKSELVQKLNSSLSAKKNTAEGSRFTDFEVDGVKFSDYVGKGKYVLVDFWASWCGPCKAEIPNIANVYRTYAGDDFNVLSVAVWDKPEDTVKAAEAHGVVWSQIINAQKTPTDIYGIDGIPHIMLIGPDGTILKRGLRGADIEKAVKEALGR